MTRFGDDDDSLLNNPRYPIGTNAGSFLAGKTAADVRASEAENVATSNLPGPIVGDIEGGTTRVVPESFLEQLKKHLESVAKSSENEDAYLQDAVSILGGLGVTTTTEEIREALTSVKKDLVFEALAKLIDENDSIIAGKRLSDVQYVDRFGSSFKSRPEDDVDLSQLIRYSEADEHGSANDHPTFILDQLVFIQGVEVSSYLTGSIQIVKNNASGHNTLTLRLDNNHDQFVWTERNLCQLFGRDYYYDENNRKQTVTNAFVGGEEIKSQVFDFKSNPDINPPCRDARNNKQFARFDLAPNRCIFARLDPIRVFSLYPFRPRGQTDPSNRELWMPEFTGFIENVSIEDDDVRGMSTITIECADIRQSIINRMRISSDVSSSLANPLDLLGFRPLGIYNEAGTAGPADPSQQRLAAEVQKNQEFFFSQENSVFFDDVLNSVYSQPLPNRNLEQSLQEFLVFKADRLRTGQASRGVRNIQYGGTFRFNNTDSASAQEARSFLSDYHKFCLFGPKRRPWTRSEVQEVGSETKTSGRFWPLNCRLWLLLPAEGTGPSNLTDLSSASIQLVHQANWTSRMEIVRNLVESLDYQMYVSGTGDIHVEFPFADFRPEDFGEFKDVFRFRKATISAGFGDEAEEPVSGVILATGFGAGASTPANPVAAGSLTTVYAYAPYIAARYGVGSPIQESVPFLQLQDRAIAQQRAVIALQKANARCHTLSFQSAYRPFLLPNRPIHHLRRSRMGTAVSVDVTFDIGRQPKATVSVGLEHVRLWSGAYNGQRFSDTNNPGLSGIIDRFTQPLMDLLQVQKDEWLRRDTNPDALGIDDLSTTDNIEAQVYTTVMAGASVPVSARVGWGDKAVLAPNTGVYVFDMLQFQRDSASSIAEATPQTNHVEEKAEQGATVVTPKTPDVSEFQVTNHVFSRRPLPGDRLVITSAQSRARTLNGVTKPHNGVDLRAPIGTPILAVEDGVIRGTVKTTTKDGGGKQINLVTNSGYSCSYQHLSEVFVSAGDKVKAGDEIGKTGNTASGTNTVDPHLHFQVKVVETGRFALVFPMFP